MRGLQRILDLRHVVEFVVGYAVDWDLTLRALGTFGIPATLLLTWSAHHQRTTFEMIDGLYSLCHKLEDHLLSDWRLAHLFCVGSAHADEQQIENTVYRRTCDAIRKSLETDATAPSLTALREKERLFAIHVFIIYEQAYYHWRETSIVLRQRKRFLREMLAYFTDRLLRNPRLLAYLQSDAFGESIHLEVESRRFLQDRLPLEKLEVDNKGPFDYELAVDATSLPVLIGLDQVRWKFRMWSARSGSFASK